MSRITYLAVLYYTDQRWISSHFYIIFIYTDVLVIERYFCYQMAWHWMECRKEGTIPFFFSVHIITGSMLPTLRIAAVQHKYLWWLCQRDIDHRKLHFGTDCLQLYIQGNSTFCILSFAKVWNKKLNKCSAMFVGK